MGPLGYAELRQGSTDAGDGHRTRRIPRAVSQRETWNGLRKAMTPQTAKLIPTLRGEAELRKIAASVLRLGKSLGVRETEVQMDETIDALTRFANNAIHQ